MGKYRQTNINSLYKKANTLFSRIIHVVSAILFTIILVQNNNRNSQDHSDSSTTHTEQRREAIIEKPNAPEKIPQLSQTRLTKFYILL